MNELHIKPKQIMYYYISNWSTCRFLW